MIDKAKGTPKYDSWSQQYALIKAIGFTYADLDANRDGYMSKKQRAALSKERRFLFNTVAIIVGGTVILHLVVLLLNMMEGGEISYGLLGLVLIFLIPVFGALFTWFQRNRLNADLYKGSVYVVEGLISLHITDYGKKATFYYIYVQEEKFQLEKPVFDAFINGEPYAVYYAPHSKTILSAEYLRDAEVNELVGDNDG
jgi:hypothetical protein